MNMKAHTSTGVSPPSLPTIHTDSRAIFRLKRKIRIIHVIAPEIIKTDVEHFRELVQRLTGKPAGSKGKTEKINKDPNRLSKTKEAREQRIKQEIEESWQGENSDYYIDNLFVDMEEELLGFPVL
ncbi:VQ motif-containing protein 25-like [Impatiens glandulifera]|uniref:VQ motif-containing protein 25-like n=1 Tax=Impatiens glandulifera TaxID=253017 RepID=UPI001FB14C43|nr:VQ motif-containing protein 25-like [Impatiens glandulifera]